MVCGAPISSNYVPMNHTRSQSPWPIYSGFGCVKTGYISVLMVSGCISGTLLIYTQWQELAHQVSFHTLGKFVFQLSQVTWTIFLSCRSACGWAPSHVGVPSVPVYLWVV